MIFRTIGLGAACLALVAESIMIPSTVSLPGLTEESVNRDSDGNGNTGSDAVQALPIPEDFRKAAIGPGAIWWLDEPLDLDDTDNMDASDWALSQPQMPDTDDVYDPSSFLDIDWDNIEVTGFEFDWDDDEFDQAIKDWKEKNRLESIDSPLIDFDIGIDVGEQVNNEDDDDDEKACPSGSSLKALICRFRHTVENKIEEVKPYFRHHHRRPCPKKLAAMAKQKAAEAMEAMEAPTHPHVSGGISKFWNHFHPHEAMPTQFAQQTGHRHHHKHHNKFVKVLHKICHGLRAFVTGFLVPVLIGVAAGMTASLLGMCVGTFLAWVWIKFVRGGKRGNASGRVVLTEADNIEAATAEKDGLLKSDTETDIEEAPPTYAERE